MMSQKLNYFVKFWDWLAYQEQDEKCPLSKNQPVGAIW